MKYIDKLVQKQLDIASELFEILNKKEITQRELSRKSGVDEPTISKIIRGLANPTLETISKLETALEEDLIVIPSFYKKDLENDGFKVVKKSITEKFELSFIDLLKEAYFIHDKNDNKIREFEYSGSNRTGYEFPQNDDQETPLAA